MKKDIISLVKEHGIENLRFLVPMRPLNVVFGLIAYKSSNDRESNQVCRITEKRDKLSQNYKVELQAENKNFGKERYYISDLNTMIDLKQIRVFVEL